MHGITEARADGSNPPGALGMGIIAFLVFNLSLGCMFGPFGVLVAAIEQKLDVTREVSTLAVPVVTFGMSLLAPVFGGLAARMSLRLLMMAGSLMAAAGFAILAVTTSVPVFIGVYALLIGPALSICGVVAPSTLVTRWFRVNRGRALGLANTPALMAALPMLAAFVLTRFGLATAYGSFAVLMLVCLAASALVRDHPPAADVDAQVNPGSSAPAGLPVAHILASSRFWRLALAGAFFNAVIVMYSTSLVPFAIGLGIDATRAALLLTFYLVGTLIGTPLIGWLADKLGGALAIGMLSLSLAVWQGLLVVHPDFTVLAVLAGLVGLHGSAMPPSLGLALSQEFGAENFSKGYGLTALVGLPFAVLSVPIASGLFVRTGSYNGAFLLASAVLFAGMVLTLSMAVRRKAAPVAAA